MLSTDTEHTSLIIYFLLNVHLAAVTFDVHAIRLNSHQMSTLARTKSVLSDTKFVAQIKLRVAPIHRLIALIPID